MDRLSTRENQMADPKVSVVVPAFNERPDVLRQSLESVAGQTFVDFECLVVDESTDPASAAACAQICAADSRFRHIRPPVRLGLAESLNLGIRHARAPWIARFDSDDICFPDRLRLQYDFLVANPGVDIVGGGLEIINEVGSHVAFRSYPATHVEIEKAMHITTSVAHPAVMFRKSLFEKLGGYNSGFRFAEDLDLWLRMLASGACFANLDDSLVRYRQQVVSRRQQHWRFNLRARTRNFATRMIVRRTLGIVAVAGWCAVPEPLQATVFRWLVLRKDKSPEIR